MPIALKSDDIGHRLLIGVQMLAIAALAVNVHPLGLLHRMGVIFKCKVRSKYRFGTVALLIILAIVGVG